MRQRVYLETTIVSYLRREMKDDPIVAEVRRIRQKIAAKFKYDVRAIAEDARKREKKSGHPIVSPRRRNKTK